MKRTHERPGFTHSHLFGMSGVRVLDGEDRQNQERKKQQIALQRDWIEQQKREKQMIQDLANEESRAYAEQDKRVSSLRGQMDEDKDMKRREMMQAMRDYNLQMAQQKKDKERAEKERDQAQDRAELDLRERSEFMREQPFKETVMSFQRQ